MATVAELAEEIVKLTLLEAVRGAKPSGVKGNYIQGLVLSATMSPGLPIIA